MNMNFNSSKSVVWNFFQYNNTVKVKCNLCFSYISRGGTGKKASTSPLLNHLRNKHKEVYEKTFSSEDADSPTTSTNPNKKMAIQPTLETVLNKKKVWDINHPASVELHYAIGKMIAIDNQPYSFVEDEGFRNVMYKAQPQYQIPSREYFKQNILPKMYEDCREKIRALISSSDYISLTTDIWTNSATNDSFISLTSHITDKDFNYRHAVLNAQHFPGSHKSEHISRILLDIITEWDISAKIYIVVRDGGKNIVKGVHDANLESESCFLHNLHLIVTDALASQRAMKDIVAIARKIVGHFNHSPLACSNFKKIQEEQLHLTYKKLVQDISTRWNSTYYMLSRILELKSAVSLYANENSEVPNFTSNQWTLIEGCLKLLAPFQDITKQISSSESVISEVIPMVVTLNKYLSSTTVFGLGTVKDSLEENINKRFSSIYENDHFSIATVLDPRFKMAFFPKEHTEAVKTSIIKLMKEKCSSSPRNLHQDQLPQTSVSVVANNKSEPKTFWDCFSEISEASVSVVNDNDAAKTDFTEQQLLHEYNGYIAKPVISRKICPFTWWKINVSTFPTLAKLAQKYLSAPASSVYSERLFSEAGLIYEKKRNRLKPKNAETLLFLHHNLRILKKQT